MCLFNKISGFIWRGGRHYLSRQFHTNKPFSHFSVIIQIHTFSSKFINLNIILPSRYLPITKVFIHRTVYIFVCMRTPRASFIQKVFSNIGSVANFRNIATTNIKILLSARKSRKLESPGMESEFHASYLTSSVVHF